MPRYDYKCSKCGLIQEFDKPYKERDKPLWHVGNKGKDCGGEMIRGWYTPPTLLGFNKQGSSSW